MTLFVWHVWLDNLWINVNKNLEREGKSGFYIVIYVDKNLAHEGRYMVLHYYVGVRPISCISGNTGVLHDQNKQQQWALTISNIIWLAPNYDIGSSQCSLKWNV